MIAHPDSAKHTSMKKLKLKITKLNIGRLFVAAALMTFGVAHAEPTPNASFDCSKAQSRIEHAICSDPKLAKSDREISDLYRAALLAVSEEGKYSLRNGQRLWLKFVDTVCSTQKAPDDLANCLSEKYGDRKERLLNAVQSIGGYKFHRVDIYLAVKESDRTDDTGDNSGFATTDLSYPLIDAPRTEAERRFNNYIRVDADRLRLSGEREDSTDEYLGFRSIKATPQLVSIESESGFYGHGAPHGQYVGAYVHWLFPQGRLLVAQDIFLKGSPWRQILVDRCYAGVAKYGVIKDKNELQPLVESPSSWSFEPDGLIVNFNPYNVASYADGSPSVFIPWSALRRYIAPNSPIWALAHPKT